MGCASSVWSDEYACIRRNRVRRAKPDKRAWAVLSKDRSRGVVRPAAEGEDTAPGGDDAAGGACLLTGPIRSVGGYEMKDRRGGGERGPWPASIPRPVRRIKHKPGGQPGFLNPLSLAGAIQPAARRGGPCRVANWTRHHRAKGTEFAARVLQQPAARANKAGFQPDPGPLTARGLPLEYLSKNVRTVQAWPSKRTKSRVLPWPGSTSAQLSI